MSTGRPPDGWDEDADRTRKLPQAEPHTEPETGATQRIPAAPTEALPESSPDGPTRAMRQVRRRTEEGPWPAIPILPVIRPDDEPLSEVERAQEHRGMRALRDYLDREQHRDPAEPAWPQRHADDDGPDGWTGED